VVRVRVRVRKRLRVMRGSKGKRGMVKISCGGWVRIKGMSTHEIMATR
jgi:hypothetical protein